MRTRFEFTVPDPGDFRQRLLAWAARFREVVLLDGNGHPTTTSWDVVLAADALTSLVTDDHNAFAALQEYQGTTRDWLFGYLSYDLKNAVEDLASANPDSCSFPDLFFFQPKRLIFLSGHTVTFAYLPICDDEAESDFNAILDTEIASRERPSVVLRQKIPYEAYLGKIARLQEHIHRGDIYEANFCMEFTAAGTIDPVSVFGELNAISAPPFAAFLKRHADYLLCASPERYLRKEGRTITSQPIKGTAKRHPDPQADAASRDALATSPKERSENIMIVDLVRNDLSHTAAKGSVSVPELCGIYTFPQVNQMISTVTSQLAEGFGPVDVIRTTFPMGSMTGAPKIRAMQLIEEFEESRRGLYSGALGYFTPEGDFDFNVVIRSILYQEKREVVSFSVGGAITALSDPEKEYEECLLKAAALLRVLGQ